MVNLSAGGSHKSVFDIISKVKIALSKDKVSFLIKILAESH